MKNAAFETTLKAVRRALRSGYSKWRAAQAFAACALAPGCASAPSPLLPQWTGSVGSPSRGVLVGGREIPSGGAGIRWLRRNDRHWGLSRFTVEIERAAQWVALQRPGAVLSLGDLSTPKGGGPSAPHFSHRSGVDADLLFYITSLDGAPVPSPGFVHIGADGIGRDEINHRWVRLDVEREWLLVRALVTSRAARTQWIFVSDVVRAMLLEWAYARGESMETIFRAETVMLQPGRGGVHDDHVHVRTACAPEEVAAGCELMGPRRAWLDYGDDAPPDDDDDLVAALLGPRPAATGTQMAEGR